MTRKKWPSMLGHEATTWYRVNQSSAHDAGDQRGAQQAPGLARQPVPSPPQEHAGDHEKHADAVLRQLLEGGQSGCPPRVAGKTCHQ